ncbi:MAG TPA: cell division protein ZapA [Terriglobales bacterium]
MASAGKEPSTDSLDRDLSNRETLDADPAAKDRRVRMNPPREMPTPTAVTGSVRVEIFDQVYNLRGSDADYIVKLAEYVDGKMRAVSEQTATVDSVRLAVLAALNIADEYYLLKRRLEPVSPEARQRASKLASALDEVLEDTRRTG